MALCSASGWSLGRITTIGSFATNLYARSGFCCSTRRKAISSFSALEVVCQHCGMVARNSDFDIEQFVSKDVCGTWQPVDLLLGLEAHGESRFDRLRGSPR